MLIRTRAVNPHFKYHVIKVRDMLQHMVILNMADKLTFGRQKRTGQHSLDGSAGNRVQLKCVDHYERFNVPTMKWA
jgi:hypothetical protein